MALCAQIHTQVYIDMHMLHQHTEACTHPHTGSNVTDLTRYSSLKKNHRGIRCPLMPTAPGDRK